MIKDEFKPKEEGVKKMGNVGRPRKNEAGEVAQLRQCMKDKDKRIRKLEDRWSAIKSCFLMVGFFFILVSLLVVVILPLNCLLFDYPFAIETLMPFFSFIGYVSLIISLGLVLSKVLEVDV